MSRAIKLKNNDYIDVSSITYNRTNIKTILDSNSKNTNGYCKLPNGLILQWGIDYSAGITVQSYSKTINFPMAFPNACFQVQLTLDDVGYGSGNFTTGIGLEARTASNFRFTIKNRTDKAASLNSNVFWFAIGY